jgi:hypothetical protein
VQQTLTTRDGSLKPEIRLRVWSRSRRTASRGAGGDLEAATGTSVQALLGGREVVVGREELVPAVVGAALKGRAKLLIVGKLLSWSRPATASGESAIPAVVETAAPGRASLAKRCNTKLSPELNVRFRLLRFKLSFIRLSAEAFFSKVLLEKSPLEVLS